MFLNTWSLALSVCSAAVLFLVIMATRTAVRVLRYWDPESDDSRQIRLENEIWLTSTLLQYTLFFQIFSLVLFILAADNFCKVIVGAMCATGSLLANPFGVPALLVKIVAVFFYGMWIVLHKIDIRSPDYPLVRLKYWYFISLLPLIFLDITLQSLYLAGLSPDIITSCCGVVFDTSGGQGNRLMPSFDQPTTLLLFYGTASLLFVLGLVARSQKKFFLYMPLSGGATFFLFIAVVAITNVFSSYIYAMPYHHCPFCILKGEYFGIGYFLYASLFLAVFLLVLPAVVDRFKRRDDLREYVETMQAKAVKWGLVLLVIFVALSSYHLLAYRLLGGER
jgi:uncharacterized membrane protein